MILVTGANGFVGQGLCAELARRGVAVRAAVREHGGGTMLARDVVAVGDLCREVDWSPALRGVDTVVHLAARVHVMNDRAKDPLEEFRLVNVNATTRLARNLVACGVRRIVYVSSIKVNGDSTRDKPFRPDDPPNPQDAYGLSKLEAEQALWRISNETGLEVVVVRPPLVYGPAVKGNFLRLLKLVQRRIPLPIGAIENRRSMIYSGNFAHALVACAIDANAAGKTYVVSDGEDLSTPELTRRLARAVGTSARLVPVPAVILRVAGALAGRTDEIDRVIGSLVVDGSRIRSELRWRPPYSMNDGLAETAKWFSSTTS